MKASKNFILGYLLLVALWTGGGRAEDEDGQPKTLPLLEVISTCFKAFEKTAKTTKNLNLMISHKNLFSPVAAVPHNEFHFTIKHTQGKLAVIQNGLQTSILRQFRTKGFIGSETVQKTSYATDLNQMQVESACQGFVFDLERVLNPTPKFTSQQVLEKFKELFAQISQEGAKLELVEVSMETSPASPTQPARAMTLSIPRQLAMGPFPRSFFRLLSPGKQVIGHVDFSQISEWTMVVNAKVYNQFTTKSFLSFTDTFDNATPSLQSIVDQLKEATVPEAVSSADLESIIRELMTDIECVDPKPEIKSTDKYSVMSWVKGQHVEEAGAEEMEGFRRGRKLLGENCPFGVLTITLLRLSVDGFPSLQVYFEGNSDFPVPIYLDYFLTGDSKAEYEEKIKFIWDKFVVSFKESEAARQIQAKKDDEYDKALKEYNEKITQDQPGSESLKLPERDPVPTLKPEEAMAQAQQHILKAQQVAGGTQPLLFVKEGLVTAGGNRVVVKSGVSTLMILDLVKDTHPRIRVTFFFSPNSKGDRTSTYQMDFSTDARLKQFSLFDAELTRYFKAAWKKAKSVL